MDKLNAKQTVTHKRAMKVARIHTKAEKLLVEILIDVENQKVHKALGMASMFQYATELLKLSEAVAYALITVARRAKVVPALREALAGGRITAAKASRVAAHIDEKNAEEVIAYASSHTSNEIDFEMAKNNPHVKVRDKVKALSEDQIQLTIVVDKATFENIQRAQSLLAQKNKPASKSDAVKTMTEFYVNAQDPVRKAKRATAQKLCLNRVTKSGRPNSAQKHTVNARDEGRCTEIDNHGKRCNRDRWVEHHHIIRKADGGSNDPVNLTTLCSFHHGLAHQRAGPREYKSLASARPGLPF